MSSARRTHEDEKTDSELQAQSRTIGSRVGSWRFLVALLALLVCLGVGLKSKQFWQDFASGEPRELDGAREVVSEQQESPTLREQEEAANSSDATLESDADVNAPPALSGNAPDNSSEPEELLAFQPLPQESEARVTFLREEISRTVETLIRDFPKQANPLSLQALVHSRFNRPDLAKEVWQQCLELDPQFVSAHAALGTIALENSQLEEAESHLRLALESNPEHEQARTSLAECLIKQNRAEEAIDLLAPQAESGSAPLIDLYHLGQAHAQLRDFETAIEYFRRAIDQAPNLTYAYYGLGTALRRLGKGEEAKETLGKFQELKQADLKAQKELAQAANDESSLRKTAAHVHFITGDVYSKAGRFAAAVAHWIRAAKLDSQEVRSRENLAQVFMQTGDFPQVVTILKELQEIESQNANHRMNLGMTYLRLGQLDAAQSCFMKAIELSPDSSDAIMATAEFLLNSQRDLEQAKRLAERGVELDNSARNYEILAMACISLGEYPAGLVAVEQALQREPKNPRLEGLRQQLEARIDHEKQRR
jgi:tetratricopeptide (TPR) repeat protein